jgi:hypothetical protein
VDAEKAIRQRFDVDLRNSKRQSASSGEFGRKDFVAEDIGRFTRELSEAMEGAEKSSSTVAERAIEKVGGIDAVKKALQTEGASDADVLKLFKTLESTGRIDEAKVPVQAPSALPKVSELPGMTVKDLRALAKQQEVKLTGITKKADIIDKLVKSGKLDTPAPVAAETPPVKQGLSDEEIDALPDPDETPAADKPYLDAASRRAFYDYLEGDQPVKGAAPLAKALRISVEEASNLIDDAIEMGWLKVNSKDQVIRVPKDRRPGRPDEPPSFMADVIGFPGRNNRAEIEASIKVKEAELEPIIDELSSLVRERDQITLFGKNVDFVGRRRLQVLNEQIAPLEVRRQRLMGEIDSLNERLNRSFEDFADAPKGWGGVGDEPTPEQDLITDVEWRAIEWLAEKDETTPVRIQNAFGF